MQPLSYPTFCVLIFIGICSIGEAFTQPRIIPLRRGEAIGNDNTDAPSLLLDDERTTTGSWVPVGSISCMEGLQPTGMEIMGQNFAVWKSSGQWSIVRDECPHRSAPLSLGRVDAKTKCLECPLHGWKFNTNGTLTSIPHLEPDGQLQPESRSVESFPVHVTGDLLWVFLPTSIHGEYFPLSMLPEDYYRGLKEQIIDNSATLHVQEMPFSFDFVAENVVDGPSHAYFAHHSLGFDRSEAGPISCKIAVSNFTDLVSEVTYRRKGTMRLRRYAFQRPFLLTNQQPVFGGGWKPAILIFAVPIRDGFTRLITTFDTLSPHPKTPDWVLHIINQRFLEGDLIMHNAEIAIRKKQSAAPNYIHATFSDLSTKAWRRWWVKYGMSSSPRHTFGPASPENLRTLTRQELTDPWKVHTQGCAKCRNVLTRSKLLKRFGYIMTWSALAFTRNNKLLMILLSLTGVSTVLVARRLQTLLEGPDAKSEIPEKSLSARN